MVLKNWVVNTQIYNSWKRFWTKKNFHQINREDKLRISFYQEFIQPGSLCFDVGANLGNRTKCFVALGAKVIAFEPQRRCFEFLDFIYTNDKRVLVIQKALGEKEGELAMLLSQSSTTSSLSPEWIEKVKSTRRFGDRDWTEKEIVSVITLDSAISEYGIPDFCKIDVEGFEDKVIAGLSQSLRYISFEFTPEYFESTRSCIQRLSSLGHTVFNYSLGESMQLELGDWLSSREIVIHLEKLIQNNNSFGDIYAHFKG
jgi:FkbM family methyltransferase